MEFCPGLHLLLKTDNMKIQIANPCHENWNAMTPNKQGAFCLSCEKTVVDFSKMNDEEIRNYLMTHLNDKVCGRFKNEQLQQAEKPSPLFHQILSRTFYGKFFMLTLLGLCASIICMCQQL